MKPGEFEYLFKRRGQGSAIVKADLRPLDEWQLDILSGRANKNRLWNELRNHPLEARLEEFAKRSKEAVD